MCKKRNSSVELLRVLCVLLIIAHHYSVHGKYNIKCYDEVISIPYMYIQCISMFGKVACSIFAIITGYYMIKKDMSNHYKKIVPLFMEMMFYSVSISLVLYATQIIPVTITDVVKSFFPFIYGNWYLVYYMIFYLFIPYVNKFLASMDKQSYFKMLLLFIVVWSIIPTFFRESYQFSELSFFFIMYATGAFIRVYMKKITKKKTIIIASVSVIAMLLSVVFMNVIGVVFEKGIFIKRATFFRDYNTILAYICAVFVFLVFISVKFHNSIINKISATSLGVYLIHDNSLLRVVIWEKLFPNIDYYGFPYVHSVVKIICVFLICTVIDLLREAIMGKAINKWLDDHWNKISFGFKKIESFVKKQFVMNIE